MANIALHTSIAATALEFKLRQVEFIMQIGFFLF